MANQTNHKEQAMTTTTDFKRTWIQGGFSHAKVRIDQDGADAPINVYATDVNGMQARLIATFQPGVTVRFKDVVQMASDSVVGRKARQLR